MIFMVLILWILYVLYNPAIIRKVVIKRWEIAPDIESLHQEHVTQELFSTTIAIDDDKSKHYQGRKYHKTFKHKIYYYTKPGNQAQKVIIDIPGGAFLVAANNLNMYFNMPNLNIDVVSIEYPVLLKATAKDTILYLEDVIKYIIENYKKKHSKVEDEDNAFEIYLVAASAGGYFGAKLINRSKFKNNITKFVGISGYYGHKSVSNDFLRIVETCYLTNTLYFFSDVQQKEYECSPINDCTIQTMLAIGKQDPLSESTIYFSKLTGSESEIFRYEGDHTFYLKWRNPETLRFYEDMELFLMQL